MVDGVVEAVAHRLPLVVGRDALGLGFGLEDGTGLPNPIEANRSSSEAPRSFFFFGFVAALDFFFGPRLVMFMVIPPICDALAVARDEAVVATIGDLFNTGGEEEDGIVADMAEATEPIDLGAAGRDVFVEFWNLLLIALPPLMLFDPRTMDFGFGFVISISILFVVGSVVIISSPTPLFVFAVIQCHWFIFSCFGHSSKARLATVTSNKSVDE